jgi:hypothetical protein
MTNVRSGIKWIGLITTIYRKKIFSNADSDYYKFQSPTCIAQLFLRTHCLACTAWHRTGQPCFCIHTDALLWAIQFMKLHSYSVASELTNTHPIPTKTCTRSQYGAQPLAVACFTFHVYTFLFASVSRWCVYAQPERVQRQIKFAKS